jgi:hypothetical protein
MAIFTITDSKRVCFFFESQPAGLFFCWFPTLLLIVENKQRIEIFT